jgi:hypothetical protein
VVIKYKDGSVYEGPYVEEKWIDRMGKVPANGRASNHFGEMNNVMLLNFVTCSEFNVSGIYRLPDGRIFEGKFVDNHFDPWNVQDYHRLKLPSGEIYEGEFCDEKYHGIGILTYSDKSVYEGAHQLYPPTILLFLPR